LPKENILKLFGKPLKDKNFRNLLFFNSAWTFALNLATPFFTVYMMNSFHLPLSYIIGFGILSQLAGIVAVKIWGRYSDSFGNKTIIRIAAPIYISTIIAWSFVGLSGHFVVSMIFIGIINIATGIASSGVNLAITNIGMKLSPKTEAIVYLSAKNMIVAFVSALGPLTGGLLADYFAKKSFVWSFRLGSHVGRLLYLHDFGFLFLIGGLFAIAALRTIRLVKEEGEVDKNVAVGELRVVFRKKLKSSLKKEAVLSFLYSPVSYPLAIKKRVERRVITMRKWNKRALKKSA
jgi:MFS family permease